MQTRSGPQRVAVSLLTAAIVVASACEGTLTHPAAPTTDAAPTGDPGVLVPVTITFGSLPAAAITSHSESGMTVSAMSGKWRGETVGARPDPSLIFRRFVGEFAPAAEVRITAGGSPFTFTSVDVYSSVTTIPHKLAGFRYSERVFQLTGTVPNTLGKFVTVVSPQPTIVLDTLLITLTNPPGKCCFENPMGLDNIVVKR